MKTLKRRAIALAAFALALLIVCVTPIPRRYKDGGTRDYCALVYRVVVWDRLYEDPAGVGQRYRKTVVYRIPDTFRSIDELWEIERANVEK